MLHDMMDGWALWLLVVGLVLGAVIAGLLLVRLPRDESDVAPDERPVEAAWIAATIERRGGVAPASFVEEVLDLHQAYLRSPPDAWSDGARPVAPPVQWRDDEPGGSRG
jgi:hypothetical protein